MKLRHLLFATSSLLAFSPLLSATTFTWDNGASNMTWDLTSFNWSSPTIPWANTTSDQAVFGAAGVGTVNLTTGITANKLTFDNGGYTIAGNTLTLAGTTPTVTANADATISSILAGSTAISKNGAGKLTLTGANTLTANVSVTQGTLELGTNGVLNRGLTVSGTAVNNATFNLAGGSMTLNNVGNFNIGGATEAGTVNISNGSLTVSGGSELTINNTNGATATWNHTGGTVSVTTGNHIYTGMGTGTGVTTNIGFSGNSSFTVNGSNTSVTFTIGGRSQTTATISGNAVVDAYQTRFGWGSDLTATDGGTLNLDGGTWKTNRIYRDVTVTTSAVNFNGGILQARQTTTGFMSGLGSANVKEGGAKIDTNGFGITIAQPLLHGGATATDGGLTKSGDGTLTLTGASTYTGPTTVNQGTLKLGAGGSISGSPTITVASGAMLDAGTGATLASGQTLQGVGAVLGNLTIGAGATLSPGNGGIGTLEALNQLTLAGTASFEINKSGTTRTSDTVSGFLSVIYGGTLKVTASGDALELNDTFELFVPTGTISGSFATFDLPALPAGRYWDTTSLSIDGTIKVSAMNFAATPFFNPLPGGYVGAQSVTITSESGSTIHYSIDGIGQPPVASPATVPVPADVTMTLTAYASKSGMVDSPPVEATYNTVTTPTWTYESSGSWTDSFNWNREVVGTGSGVTADFSTLSLVGSQTVSLNGPRTIGSLVFGDTTDGFGWILAPGTGGALTLNNGANAPVITVNNQSTTISTELAGSNGLTKAGAGTLRLSAANTYTGGTTINGGTLEFATPGLLTYGGGQININNGSTVKIFEMGFPYRYDFGAVTYNFGATGGGTISATGALTNWVAQGNWTFKTNGGARNTISGNTVRLNMNGKSVLLDVVRGSDAASDLDVILPIGNTVGGLTKTGAGIVILGGINDYTGATNVNQGTLLVNGSLAAASAVTVASGASVGGSGSIGGTTIASGAFVAPGTNGTGTFTVASATLNGTYLCQLGATAGDEVIVTGALTVNPGAAITVSTVGTPTASSYIIATYGSLAGTLPTVTGIPEGYALNTATTGQIRLVKTGGFNTWADSFPGLTDKTPGGDPDHDGVSNLMEYVVGGDPRVSSRSFLPAQTIVGTDLVLTYKRSDDSEADTTQAGQWSNNLANWNAVPPVLVNENGTDPDDMKIVIPMSNAAAGKLFGRLQVTQP